MSGRDVLDALGLPSRGPLPVGQNSFVFEATARCNHDCPHCYNVWKGPGPYALSELGTGATLALLDRMLEQTGATLVSVSGGEPMLRADILPILRHLRGRGAAVNLITNGSRLDAAAVRALAPLELDIVEIPLLSVDRAVHDRMSGSQGAFDAATLAMAELKAAGQRVVGVFVATAWNLAAWRETFELAVALGLDGIMFNRFNAGGRGRENAARLAVAPGALCEALDAAQALSERYRMPVSCSIPMQPCLFPHERWPALGFGFCAAGTANAYYTLDWAGNVRPCNHSPTILGNLLATPFEAMVTGDAMRAFHDAGPAFCGDCSLELVCRGGCKAAAEVCGGSIAGLDPFLAAHKAQAEKP